MKGEYLIYPLLSLPELLLSNMQPSMLSEVFAQIESRFNSNHSEIGFHDSDARRVASISTVDKGIDATRQFLRSLLTRRNSLLPISLLPPEILASIFHLLVLEEPPLSGKRNLGWLKVTHVCQHWRQIALDNLSLWAKIWGNPTDTNWISEILVRAKNAPLDIKFDLAMSSPKTILMILPHLSHTRQLRFHGLSTLHSNSVREIYNCEAPALEHFELTVSPYSPISRYSPMAFPDLGGNMLFKGHAPRLRTFLLSQLVIPWSLIPRGHLTQLKVAVPKEDVHSPGDLNQLIDLLVNCPALEILALESCLPSQLTEFSHGRTIHLPHLSRLRLCGSTSRIVNISKMLKLTSLTKLHLNCISDNTHNDPEGLLLPIISAHFQSPAPIEFKGLTFSHMSRSFNITASTFPSTLPNCQSHNFDGDILGNPEVVLSFDMLSKPGHPTDLLKQACKMLPISNLESFFMLASKIIPINWVELFGCCTNVNTVQAIGDGTGSLVRALTAPTVTNAGSSKKGRKRKHNNRENTVAQPASTAHAAIFPNLKFLGLTEVDFDEGKNDSGNLFDVFERGLRQRMAASGTPLKFLRISDCDISTKRANRLRKFVQDFHFNMDETWIDGLENFGAYEQRLYRSGEVAFLDSDRGTVRSNWDSEDDNSTDTGDLYQW